MERESNQMQALCRSGCGFYGNPATDGLCSICYKEALKKKQQPPVTSSSTASAVSNNTSLSSLMETATAQPTVTLLSSTTTANISISDTMSDSQIPSKKCNSNENSSHDSDVGVSESKQSVCNSTTVISTFNQTDATTASNVLEEVATTSKSVESAINSPDDKDNDKDAKKKKNRCATCRKKVGLTGFECRCGGLFCAVHRYSDKHDCSFNYREMGAEEIRRNNPVVVGEKIQKI